MTSKSKSVLRRVAIQSDSDDPEERRKGMQYLKDQGYTLQEIGDAYGISRQRVHQILDKKYPKKSAKWRENARRRALDILGGKCVECGEDDWRVLCLDHKESDGWRLRRRNIRGRDGIYAVIRGEGDHLQVLCYNCNIKKAYIEGEWTKTH